MRTINVEPLTRVEGHGRVELRLVGERLTDVKICLVESPRLFEEIVRGRLWKEIPALVCRICAICSSVHRLAAAAALERAFGVEIPPAARLVRTLLLLGGHIESHALHLFCLVLPDLRRQPSILPLLQAGDPAARRGVALKALGNRIQEVAGGRMIHPVNVEVGGIVKLPERSLLDDLQRELALWDDEMSSLLEVFCEPEGYPWGTPAVGTRLSVVQDGGFTLNGEELLCSDGRRVEGEAYQELLQEQAVPYSNAKRSGDGRHPFLAGALARVGNYRRGASDLGPLPVAETIYGNNAAQSLELLWAIKECQRLIDELLQLPASADVLAEVRPEAGVGIEVVEAPRGLLIHRYVLDDFGRVAEADIVTPTAINQAAIEVQLLNDLAGVEDAAELARRAGIIVRAFDPCISCSVHVLKS